MNVRPLGDRALRVALEDDVDRPTLVAALRGLPGVIDACATESDALAVFSAPPPATLPLVRSASAARSGRTHAVDVVLDGEDLQIALAAGFASHTELVRALETHPLEVSFVGFCPGFAYLRGLDPRLAALPRRASPRPRVPAGSFAVAGGFAGIYPFATPGGWNLLGRSLLSPFEGDRARFAPGDRVRLQVAPRGETPRALVPQSATTAPALVVVRAAPAFVQDLGRVGRLAEGVPVGGALVPSALVRANRVAGAPDGAAAIERFGPLVLEARAPVRLATDGGEVHEARAGERVELGWGKARRVGYVGVRGGLHVPVVLGGRGTHVAVGIGGHEGRALRRGDLLGLAGDVLPPRDPPRSALREAIRVVPGPDAKDALAPFLAAEWRVSMTSDRTGVRLEGPPLPPVPARTSAPMVRGAIELPPSGGPIVLGPDHPTTGGYPVVACVRHDDCEHLFSLPPGSAVRFVEG